MPKIRLVRVEDAPLVQQSTVDHATKSPRRSEIRTYFEGTESELEMFEVHKLPPSGSAEPHAHDADEIMYVLEGSLIVGDRSYGPGSAIYVPAETLYSFGFGSDGVRYLNFRPRRAGRISKEDLVARLRLRRT